MVDTADSDSESERVITGLHTAGVQLVAGSVTDLAGVTRAKYVPLRRLGAFADSGMGVSPSWSVFCVDSGIAFTPSIGVVGDLRIRIDPAEVRVIEDGLAWAPGGLYDQFGHPAPLCVRALLRAVEDRAAGMGLRVLMGAEIVRAPHDHHVLSEGVIIRQRQHIRRGLARGFAMCGMAGSYSDQWNRHSKPCMDSGAGTRDCRDHIHVGGIERHLLARS